MKSKALGLNFNSTMVRLKDVYYAGNGKDVWDFNSTMVRLKDKCSYEKNDIGAIFQFHYGSVKSAKGISFELAENIFQFHYGSVKSVGFEIDREYFDKFQFHYGSVKSS